MATYDVALDSEDVEVHLRPSDATHNIHVYLDDVHICDMTEEF